MVLSPMLTNANLQCSQNVSFRPETGHAEVPQNNNNPKPFGTNLFQLDFSILFLVFRFFAPVNYGRSFENSVINRLVPQSFKFVNFILGKFATCFREESFFF